MLSPLFIKIYTNQRDAILRDVLFFQLCLDHLGFLITEHDYEVRCDAPGGPDAYVEITFFNHANRITISAWKPYGLPTLNTIRSDRAEVGRICDLENEHGDFSDAFARVHPLDALGECAVRRAYQDAVIARITKFGTCLRKNFGQL